jgi:tetratricopeptide (TPR) repeat protein
MRHPLVHEVAYRSLLLARRRELHRRIGAWLEEHGGEDSLSEVAAHYRDGADLDRARELLPRAAERAARMNAQREALEAYRQAADLFEDDPERRAEMLERAAVQSFLSGSLQEAIAFISEARDLYERAGNQVLALNARRLRGRYYWLDGRGVEAEVEIDAAVEGLEALPPTAELALAYSYRSQLAFLSPDFSLGERLARRAIAVAEQVGSVEALAHALNNLGMCRAGLGDPAGLDDVRRSLALSLEHNLIDDASRAYTNMSGQGAAISIFTYEESEAFYEEMLAFDQRTAPGGNYEQWHLAGRSELWISVGRWDDAERQLRELATRAGANRYIQLDVAIFLSLLVGFRGRHDEALALVRPHVEVSVQIGDLQAYAPTFVALAHAEAGHGDAAAAVAAIERFVAVRGDTHEHNVSTWALFELADVATWLRRRGEADASDRAVAVLLRLAEHLEADVGRGGTPPELTVRSVLYRAAVLQLRNLAGEPVPDAAAFGSLAATLREHHRLFDAARVELWLAEASGGAPGAETVATLEELRAAPYLDRVQK